MSVLTDFSPRPTEVGPLTLNVRLLISQLREVKRTAQEMALESPGWSLSPVALPPHRMGSGCWRVPPRRQVLVRYPEVRGRPLPGSRSCASFSRQGPQRGPLPFLTCPLYQGTRCSREVGRGTRLWAEELKEEGSSWLHSVGYPLSSGSQILFCDERFTIIITKFYFWWGAV